MSNNAIKPIFFVGLICFFIPFSLKADISFSQTKSVQKEVLTIPSDSHSEAAINNLDSKAALKSSDEIKQSENKLPENRKTRPNRLHLEQKSRRNRLAVVQGSRASSRTKLTKSQANSPLRKASIIGDSRKTKTERVEGYVTTVDAKGNESTDYVYGEINKSKSGSSGYLYGDKNKSYYVYGHGNDGTLQIEKETGDVIIDDKKVKKKKKNDFSIEF